MPNISLFSLMFQGMLRLLVTFIKNNYFPWFWFAIPEGCRASGDFAILKKLVTFVTINHQISTLQKNRLNISTLPEIVTSMATPLVQRPSTVSSKRPENLANKLSLDGWRLQGPRLEMGWESCWTRFFWTFFLFRGLPRELWGELAPLKIGDEIDEFQ